MSNVETSLLEFILAAATKSGYWLLDRIEMKFRKLDGYTATPVACRWSGAVINNAKQAFGQEQKIAKIAHLSQKSN